MQKCAALLTGVRVVSAHDLFASSYSIESRPTRVADRVWAPNSAPLVQDKAGRLDRHLTTSCPDMPSGNSTTDQGSGGGASTEIMGWLVDLLCWDRADHLAIDGAVLDEEPWMHSAHCMHLGGPIHPEHKDTATDCYHSGFGIIQESLPSSGVYDLVSRLDDAGNMKAQQLVDNMCAGTRNVWVKVFTDGTQMAGSGSGSSAAPMIGVECLMWVQGGREVESGEAGRRLQNQPSHITCPGGDSQVQQCWDITLAECTSAFDALPMHPTPAPPAPPSSCPDMPSGDSTTEGGGNSGASTEIMGWLVDLLCWDRADHLAIDGAVLDEEPWMHSAHCMHLGGPIHPEHKDTATDCYHSGFGIIQESLPSSGVYDLVYRLDAAGNMKAQQLVDNMCAGTRNVWVKVFTDGTQMAGSGSGSSAAPMIGVECLMWVQGGREVESGDAGRRLQNQPSHITCPGGDSQVQQCWDFTLAECTSAFDALPMHPTPAPPAPSSTTSDDEGGVNSAPAAGLGGAMLALSASALWQ